MAESYFDYRARRFHFFRYRIARGGATNDDRRSVGLDELHHAADVAVVRHVLLIRTISSSAATVHPGFASDCPEQRAPISDERRRGAFVELDSARCVACLVSRQFRCRTENL